ncbi:hypothetical protein MLD38_037586 [Melastoma candidum]|uniref:Uncharacterized protein n=1 Tax=Melastoma candidum TaxID=119954 RepID=A0ACB9LNR0_9MYRT|nr:hypothetical protein MLD38_037586 [Melastoma candidum]
MKLLPRDKGLATPPLKMTPEKQTSKATAVESVQVRSKGGEGWIDCNSTQECLEGHDLHSRSGNVGEERLLATVAGFGCAGEALGLEVRPVGGKAGGDRDRRGLEIPGAGGRG